MSRTLFAALLLSFCVPLAAQAHVQANDASLEGDCEVDSAYDFHLTSRSVIFLRGEGRPSTVLMRGGRLFVDDRWVAVDAADARRIRDYEREARAVMPIAHDVGREAAQIAFAALGQVAAGLSADPARTQATLAKARTRIDAHLATSITATHFSSDTLGDGIGDAIAEVLPSLVGDLLGGAIGAAFRGDAARLERMEHLDAEIEATVKPRAEALAKRMDALCRRMEALDAIENALSYRLPGGAPLALLEVRRESRDRDR